MSAQPVARVSVARLAALACFLACLVLALAAEVSKGTSFFDLLAWAGVMAGAGGALLAVDG